jgi:hypothetical protein
MEASSSRGQGLSRGAAHKLIQSMRRVWGPPVPLQIHLHDIKLYPVCVTFVPCFLLNGCFSSTVLCLGQPDAGTGYPSCFLHLRFGMMLAQFEKINDSSSILLEISKPLISEVLN